MKKILLIWAIAVLFFSMCTLNSKKQKVYRVAIDLKYPPFTDKDSKDGSYKGYLYDIMSDVEKNGNFKFIWSEDDFSKIIEKVTKGEYDIGVGAFTLTDERKEKVDFLEYQTFTEVVVLGNNEIEYLELNTPIYGVAESSYFEQAFNKIEGSKSMIKGNHIKLLDNLKNKEIDYIILDRAVALDIIGKNPNLYIKSTIDKTGIGAVVSKKMSRKDLKEMNKIILEMQKNGTLAELKKIYNIIE